MQIVMLCASALVQSFAIGVAIVVLLSLGFRGLCAFSASTRSAAWATAIVASVAIPLAWALVSVASLAQSYATATPHRTPWVVPAQRSAGSTEKAWTKSAGNLPLATVPAKAPRVDLRITLSAGVLKTGILVWAIVAGGLLLRLALQYARLARHLQRLPQPSQEESARLAASLRRTGCRRRVRFVVSDDYAAPAVAGLAHAVMVLPPGSLSDADPAAADRIVAHEAAHLSRHDDYVDLAVRIALALAFFNPTLWYARSRLALDREIACDDCVLRECGSERDYAKLLVRVARGVRRSPSLAMTSSARQLTLRIEAILAADPNRSVRSIPGIVAACGLVVAASMLALPLHVSAASAQASSASSRSTSDDPAHAQFGNAMAPGSTLHLYTYAGDVAVKTVSSDHVAVEARAQPQFGGEKPMLRFSGSGVDSAACTLPPSKSELRCSDENSLGGPPVQRVDWQVSLPAGRNITIHTGLGAVVVASTGEVEVRNGKGDITATGRIVDAQTQDGSIVAALSAWSLPSSVTLDARHGSLRVGLRSELRAQIVATSFGGSIQSAIPMKLGKEPGFDALIGRATLRGAGEHEKLILMAGSAITISAE